MKQVNIILLSALLLSSPSWAITKSLDVELKFTKIPPCKTVTATISTNNINWLLTSIEFKGQVKGTIASGNKFLATTACKNNKAYTDVTFKYAAKSNTVALNKFTTAVVKPAGAKLKVSTYSGNFDVKKNKFDLFF